jgi:leader peptidase (prepilin peptidase)/N-methyltransferase
MSSATPAASAWLRAWGPGAWVAMALAAAGLIAFAAARSGATWALVPLLPLALATPLLAAVDLRWRIVPNRLVLPLALVLLATASASALALGQPLRIVGALLGAAAMFAVYLAPALLTRRAMGMGDVKLALALGTVLGASGWQTWILGVLAGFIAGAVAGLVLLLLRRATLRSRIPYAPAMLVGTWVALLLAQG